MSQLLEWQPLAAADRGDIADFVCSEPPPPLPYGSRDYRLRKTLGAHWERTVQSGLRNLHKNCHSVPTTDIVLVGRDSVGIGAVGWAYQYRLNEWWLLGLAVALRLRPPINVTGQGYGDELMDEMLNEIATRSDAVGEFEVLVRARIHERNLNSQKLAARARFVSSGERDIEDPSLIWWEQLMDLTP